MPDHVVVLFMFGVLASFGTVWLANDLRLRYQARYLEYNFYFVLSATCYGIVNWIVPFIVIYLAESGGTDPLLFVTGFFLVAVPVLLAKLYFLYLLFQELLAREKPTWFNKLSLVVSLLVLAFTVWTIKSYYDDLHSQQLKEFIIGLGLVAVVFEFVIVIRYLITIRGMSNRVIGAYSLPFGWLFLAGYAFYVFAAYSSMLLAATSLVELSPYIYFVVHALLLVLLWLFHQREPAAVLKTNSPNIIRFIETNALTAKEAEILKQIIKGATNSEIADHSCISPHTVRNHIYNIYNKTGIRNRFQLLAICQADDQALVD